MGRIVVPKFQLLNLVFVLAQIVRLGRGMLLLGQLEHGACVGDQLLQLPAHLQQLLL